MYGKSRFVISLVGALASVAAAVGVLVNAAAIGYQLAEISWFPLHLCAIVGAVAMVGYGCWARYQTGFDGLGWMMIAQMLTGVATGTAPWWLLRLPDGWMGLGLLLFVSPYLAVIVYALATGQQIVISEGADAP